MDDETTTERSTFSVPGMDCPSEEQTIRSALSDVSAVRGLSFDLPGRGLTVWHDVGSTGEVAHRLERLGFGARLVGTSSEVAPRNTSTDGAAESRVLKVLLAINATMFVVEIGAGLAVESAGLLADSLDMLADAFVYGLSLYAVGKASASKLKAAHASGLLQLVLALGALAEVARRFVQGSEPEGWAMSAIAIVALAANVACLVLVSRHREGGAHMKASYIFSTNDVIANLGVILAGALVAWTGSPYPDLVIGTGIGAIVLWGAVRILRLR